MQRAVYSETGSQKTSLDPRHLLTTERSTTTEFHFAGASGRTSYPERTLLVLTAAEATCGAMFSTVICRKGSKDTALHTSLFELHDVVGFLLVCAECDREANAIDVRNIAVRRANLISFESSRGRKRRYWL